MSPDGVQNHGKLINYKLFLPTGINTTLSFLTEKGLSNHRFTLH